MALCAFHGTAVPSPHQGLGLPGCPLCAGPELRKMGHSDKPVWSALGGGRRVLTLQRDTGPREVREDLKERTPELTLVFGLFVAGI